MGSPIKLRKSYETPKHPYQKSRIDSEKILKREYGLKNKKEIWKAETTLKSIKDQVKNLITRKDSQAVKEKNQLNDRIVNMGLLKKSDLSDDSIFSLDVKSILDRRLQSLMVTKNLVRTAKQARQFITHGHVVIADQKIVSPSYMVPISEEDSISFSSRSHLFNEDHPERSIKKTNADVADQKEKLKSVEKEVKPVVAKEAVKTESSVNNK